MTKEDHHDRGHHGHCKGKDEHLTDDSSTESKGKGDRRHRKDRHPNREESKGRRKREREQGHSKYDDDDNDNDEDSSRRHESHRKHHRSAHKKRRRGDDDYSDDEHSSEGDDSNQRRRHKISHRKRETDERKRKDRKSHTKAEKKDKKHKKTKKERSKSRRDKHELQHGDHRNKAALSSRSQSTRHQHDKKAMYSMGETLGQPPLTLIDPERDYFTYHQEFWVYLFREEGVRFNDLNSEEAREAFQRFATQYNDGKLERPYYDNPPTFPSEVLEECKTTDHKWGFQTTEAERRGLEKLQEGVRRLTQYQDQNEQEVIGTYEGSSVGLAATRAIEGDGPATSHQKTTEERLDVRRGNRS